MRLSTVCFRHVLVLSGCQFYASVGLFFSRLRRFFQAIPARSCAPLQFFTVQDLVRGECDVWSFYKHALAFVPFSFYHPFVWGSSRWSTLKGGSPSPGQNHCSYLTSLDTLVIKFNPFGSYNSFGCHCIYFLSLFLWYFGCLCLAHRAPTNSLSCRYISHIKASLSRFGQPLDWVMAP